MLYVVGYRADLTSSGRGTPAAPAALIDVGADSRTHCIRRAKRRVGLQTMGFAAFVIGSRTGRHPPFIHQERGTT
jgi:hypothetical protein